MRGKYIPIAFVAVLIALGLMLFGAGSLTINEIEIEGGGRIATAEIQALTGFHVGQPWSAKQAEIASSAIFNLPLVKDVSIFSERVSLQAVRVKIHVGEREPFGIIELQNKGQFWVDSHGRILYPAEGRLYLPVLSGVSVEEDSDGNLALSPDAQRVAGSFFSLPGDLIGRFRSAALSDSELELTTHEGQRVRVTASGLKEQLERLARVTQKLAESGISAWRLIDLRFAGEATIKR